VIAADTFMLIFRFFHIVCGALWIGSAFLFVGFIGPSAAEAGPSAMPLLTAAVRKRKVAVVITVLGWVTVIAGWTLWFKDASRIGSIGDWLGTTFGKVLTVGGILATITAFVGMLGVGRNVERLVDMGNEIGASGGPPSPEQQGRMEQIGASIEKFGKIDLLLLFLAITLMSTARYW